jgi:hypothetical protein
LHWVGVHLFDVTVTNIAGEKVEGEYRITSGQHVNALPVAAFHSPADREKMPELEPLWGRLVVGWRYIAITHKTPADGRLTGYCALIFSVGLTLYRTICEIEQPHFHPE